MTMWKLKHSKIALASLTALSLQALSTPAHAADNSIRIVINGVQQNFDVAPYVKNDSTYIPLRGVLEKLGAHVFWNDLSKQVIVKKGDTFVTLIPDVEAATINGELHELDAAPEIQNDRTMVPLRFLGEALGGNVQWDDQTQTVSITSTPEQTTSSRQFNMYVNEPILTIDPASITNDYTWNLLQQLYEGLTHVDEQGRPIPGVAESWESSVDGLTWTFHLRADAKWSDGSSVTASDFENGWKQALDTEAETTLSFLFDGIQGVHNYQYGPGTLREVGIHATDERTLTVKLEKPMPWFPLLAAEPIFSPNKKARDDSDKFDLTNGPFSIAAWMPYFDMQLEKSPTYWDRAHVQLDKVHVQTMPNFRNEFLSELYAGGAIDEAPILIAQQEALKNHPDRQALTETDTSYLMYNESNPALKNAKIRRALSYAIDTSAFTSAIYQDRAKPAVGLVAPGVSDGSCGGDYRQHAGDVLEFAKHSAQAKQLLTEGLQEAGLSQLPPLTLTIETGDLTTQIAEYINKQWQDVLGFKVQINAVSPTEKYRLNETRKYDISFNTWGADYNDPMTFLDLLRTDSINNQTGYSNPNFDALLKQANNEHNFTTRAHLLAQAEKLAMQDAPVSPLMYRVSNILLRPSVHGFHYVSKGQNYELKNVVMQGK